MDASTPSAMPVAPPVRLSTIDSMGNCVRTADERMRKVLTPEQWEEFRRSREEMRGRGRRGRNRGEASPPPAER